MPHLGDRAPASIRPTALMDIGRSAFEPLDLATAADPNDPNLWLPGQGQTNACGTTTLSYIMRHLMGDAAPPRESIDTVIRRGNIFSAPGLLTSFARSRGLAAELYDSMTIERLFELVDRSIPVMTLLDTTPLNLMDTANLHWVAVVGHDDHNIVIYNPHGFQEQLDVASFQSHWREARLFGLPAWRSLAIAIAPPGTQLPRHARSGLSSVGANLAAEGIARLMNARSSLATSAGVRTPVQKKAAECGRMLAGAGQTALGSVALLIGAIRAKITPRR